MRHWIYLALVFATTPAVHATETPASRSISFDQVIVNVLEHNPQPGINGYEARAAAANIRLAQQSAPLGMKLELQNFSGSGDYGGTDRLETTLSLAKILQFGGKISSRSDVAQQQANLLRDEQDSKRLDLLATAAEQFIHLVVDQHRLRIAQEQVQLMERTHEIVTQRLKAGKSHIAEQRRVAIALIRAEIELEHAVHELAASRLKLSISWGETQPQFGSAEANLFELPPVKAFTQLEALLANNPDLIRLATEERVTLARLRLARTRRTPNLELSGGIRYFSDPGDAALVLSASIPFGSSSRAKPEIKQMQNLARREPLRYEQRRLALYSSLYEIYQELLHARTAFEVLSQRIISQAERTVNDYEQGYKSGRFSLLELNEAQQILLDTRLETVIAAANYHRYRIEIERLTGAAMQLSYSGVTP